MSYTFHDGNPGRVLTSTRHVGVEIECYNTKKRYSPKDLVDLKLPMEVGGDYSICHNTLDGKTCLSRNEFKTEPANLSAFEKNITKIMSKITDLGYEASDRSCGMHIHIDGRDFWQDKELCDKLALLYMALEDPILSIIDPQRIDKYNGFRMKNSDYGTIEYWMPERAKKHDRVYGIVNMQKLDRLHTIEVRAHEGCIDPIETIYWADLQTKIVDYGPHITLKELFRYRDLRSTHGRLVRMFDMVQPHPDTRAFFLEKYKRNRSKS